MEDATSYSGLGPLLGLDSIPPDVLAKCLQHLPSSDIHNLEVCSRGCRSSVSDERVWFELVNSQWAQSTDIRKWLPSDIVKKGPRNYRQLYQVLKTASPLIGLWRIVGEGPEGGLVACRWTNNGIRCDRISYTALENSPLRTLYAALCYERRQTFQIEWSDDANVTLSDIIVQQADSSGLRRVPSSRRTTEAVAAAALSPFSTSAGGRPLGSSPQGSFEAEWLTFMSSNVAVGRSKTKKRSSRGLTNQQPVMHHLRRVNIPSASARHPLAGLWLGDYGEFDGIQFLKVSYDFSGQAAKIVGKKVTGDGDVAAGCISWTAAAAALKHPLPEDDQEMVQGWQQRYLEEEMEAGMDAIILDDDSITNGSGNGLNASNSGGGLDANSGNNTSSSASVLHGQIVSVHAGVGVMRGNNKAEGRLWVHGDGCMTFHWLTRPVSSVTMRRVQPDDEFR